MKTNPILKRRRRIRDAPLTLYSHDVKLWIWRCPSCKAESERGYATRKTAKDGYRIHRYIHQ